MVFDSIQTPTLLLDQDRCMRNIRCITKKTKHQSITLRPHFKTHQSHEIGRWFRSEGVDQITVSSIGMAKYFQADHWDDITIAFPTNLRQLEDIKSLSAHIRLGLVAVDAHTIEVLGKGVHHPVSIWIKIDVGTHRTGVSPDETDRLDQMVSQLGKYEQIHFAGFLAHAGHSYRSASTADVQKSYSDAVEILSKLKERYLPAFPGLKTSLGDTPGVSIVNDLRGVDELRPGNFVFYDLMQVGIGSCRMEDIAVAMACPVVAVHPNRYQWIIYGGGIHFSKDFLSLPDGRACFGRMVSPQGEGWSTSDVSELPYLASLSQEHGVVQCTKENFHLHNSGDLSLWLPVHSCLTADVMGEYLSLEGKWIDHYRKRVFK